jgi:beta-glucosidase
LTQAHEQNFLWGVATSSHQVEGYNDKNDWSHWESLGHVEGGVKSGSATDHFNRFCEDIRLISELGLNSYRFSVEWSRLEPEEGCWSQAAFEWYSDLIAECERYKITPMLTAHHFTSPKWFADKGGFAWEFSSVRFTEYVRRLAQAFGSRVPLWCTFNEPMVLVVGSYLGQFMPPAQVAPQLVPVVCHNLLKSHVAAYQTIHREAKKTVQVGIAHNMLHFVPDRKWHPMEHVLRYMFHRFYNRSWLDAVTGRKQNFGIKGFIPSARPVAEAVGKTSVDFIGVNYYTKAYTQWRPRVPSHDRPEQLPVGLAFAHRNEKTSDLGWAIHPKGFAKMLNFAGSYNLPLYITENGIADREDQLRSDYIRSHLKEVGLAIKRGLDIRGYYYWSLIDNFEWIKGFWPRFGLYHVDYDTFSRSQRESAAYFRDIVKAHKQGEVFKVPDPSLFK